jgi:hypothetical protein
MPGLATIVRRLRNQAHQEAACFACRNVRRPSAAGRFANRETARESGIAPR